jgi:apolipoprotein N-acyltransferase
MSRAARAPVASATHPTRAPYAAATLSGLLLSVCFLRFQLFPLAWVGFAPLLWALARSRGPGHAARLGLLAGLAANVPAFYWLVYTIRVFGGFSTPVAIFFYLCLSVFAATQFVLFALAWRRSGPGPLGLAAPVLWVSLEFLFPNLFPWRLANSQLAVPLVMQIGDLTGPYGLSFVMVWVSAGLVLLAARPRRVWPLVAAVAGSAAVIAYGAWRLPAVERAMRAAPTFRVALVQGNVGIKEKGDYHYFDVNIDKYQQLSRQVQDSVDLLIWPETVSQYWVATEAAQLAGKYNPFPDLRTHLIFGGLAFRLTGPREGEEFNSAFLIGPDGVVLGRYDKRILMPFGEYLPLASYFPALRAVSPATAGFTAGRDVTVFDLTGKAKVGQLICYEDLVADMPRHSTQRGAEALINILNDAWYGNTVAPYQHQALALWRAIENRRYLLRGSNTGVTSIIDATGRVVAEAGLFTAESITGTVHRLHLATFYTWYGDVFAWSMVSGAAVLLGRGGGARR